MPGEGRKVVKGRSWRRRRTGGRRSSWVPLHLPRRDHGSWAAAGRVAAGLGPAEPAEPAMGDRERNKKRLLELLQATGTGNAHCADCGAAGKGAATGGSDGGSDGGSLGPGAGPRPSRPLPSS